MVAHAKGYPTVAWCQIHATDKLQSVSMPGYIDRIHKRARTVFASKTPLLTTVYLSSLVGKLLGIFVSGGLLRYFTCYAAALLHQGL